MNSTIKCFARNYDKFTGDCKGSFDDCKEITSCEHNCFLLWSINGTRHNAGCGLQPNSTAQINQDDCKSTCVAHRQSKERYYCCCTTDFCNYNFTIPEHLLKSNATPSRTTAQLIVTEEQPFNYLWSLVPVFVIFIIIGLYIINKKRRPRRNPLGELNGDDDHLHQHMIDLQTRHQSGGHITANNNYHNHHSHHNHNGGMNAYHRETDLDGLKIDLNEVKLLDVLGRGRFGIVYRAFINNVIEGEAKQEVAVKVINAVEYQSWQNERFVYKSHRIRHPNILNYLYSEEHVDSSSYWLIVEYAPRGSLYSHLKGNTVKWEDFLNMLLGIVQGLNHLHDAYIAHRDFKSTNVLLKQDLTPCITDFGFAKIFDTPDGSQMNQKILQVGTPRYMAPEVLECNVHLAKSSFLKIDVYALSLVLWELLSRAILPRTTRLNHHHNHHHQHQTSQLSALRHGRHVASHLSFNGLDAVPLQQQEQRHLLMTTDQQRSNLPDNNNTTDQNKIGSTRGNSNGHDDSSSVAYKEYAPPPFMLPFEDITGPHPSIERMVQVVVNEKQRPPFYKEWTACPRLDDLCRSVLKEGWETDYDARITASCLLERVTTFVDTERALLKNEQQ